MRERKSSPEHCLTWVERKQKKSEVPCGVAEYNYSVCQVWTTFSEVCLRIKFPVDYWSKGGGGLSGFCRIFVGRQDATCGIFILIVLRGEGKKKVRVWLETTDRVIAENRSKCTATRNSAGSPPKNARVPAWNSKLQILSARSPWMYNRSVETASRMRRKDNGRTA